MKNVRRCFLPALMACCLMAAEVQAQEGPAPRSVHFGAGISVKYPYESIGDEYRSGYGLHAIMDYPVIPLLDLTADIGWNHFPRGDASESLDIWEFVGGARVRLGVFFMSGEVWY